jgi:hypothetical protein
LLPHTQALSLIGRLSIFISERLFTIEKRLYISLWTVD